MRIISEVHVTAHGEAKTILNIAGKFKRLECFGDFA
jgi:hypothetical protein